MSRLNADAANELKLYKLRAAEYQRRYESMRSLEWKVLLQVYAGYAAIAVVFVHLTGDKGWPQHLTLISWLGMTATFLFYLATRYLSFRIQERLISFNKTYEAYMAAMHSLVGVEQLGGGTSSLSHQYYWTYHTQLVISTLTLVGLLTFEAASGSAMNPIAAWIVFPLLGVLLIFVGYKVKPGATR